MFPAQPPDPVPAAVPLDPLRFPLRGRRLIEASAGTGKTWTIAALYLRLILGHPATDGGDDAAPPRPLTPPEILVVTFTEAATQELRGRIRARLAEAAAAFRGVAAPADPFLAALRGDWPEAARAACAHRLQLAAEWMDEAAISTIHAFCQRVLREHAFASDSLFSLTLASSLDALLDEAVRDYWRTFVYPLPEAAAAEWRTLWADPAALAGALRALLPHAGHLPAVADPAALFAAAQAGRAARLAALKAPWAGWLPELRAAITAAVAARHANANSLKAAWLDVLADWAADPGAVLPALTEAAWRNLSPDGLEAIWKFGDPPQAAAVAALRTLAGHPAIPALAGLRDALAALPDARADLLCHAARWVAAALAQRKLARGLLGFDDLLTRLDAALAGPGGEALAALIRRQFPVVLIDEFQDTDAIQYRIFTRIHPDPADAAGALILIGDPKQAIYAFRGADIHTYLAARAATAGRRYTLARNHRASAAMVAAVNHVFARAEARTAGQGAFAFRQAGANPLPFHPAEAAGQAESFRIDGLAAPALTCWHLPPGPNGRLTRTDYRALAAEVCASTITRLLALARAGRAGYHAPAADGGAVLRPVAPADCAVLVNDRNEAAAVRAALARRGVRSVYLSEQESVLDTPEAAELQYWLAACADPDDDAALRSALATATLALDWAALDALNHDELLWEARVLQFRHYRGLWQRQGVLPMLRHLLHDFDVPARLLADPAGGGERRLTNLLHLAELLQQASARIEGEHALLRHFAELCAEGGGDDPESRQIRLESDADLVPVITIHKSKGLEYPLVFLPCVAAFRARQASDLPLSWHDAQGVPRIALTADPEVLARADQERLGEDLRKLYVALTRARHATWLGVGALPGVEGSAIGYLLAGGAPLDDAALGTALAGLAGGEPAIAVHPVDPARDAAPDRLPPAAGLEAGAARARLAQRPPAPPWWIASYSALRPAAAAARDGLLALTPDEAGGSAVMGEAEADPVEAVFRESRDPGAPTPPAASGWHAFPRGAEAGTFLHELLEWIAGRGFAAVARQPAQLRDLVARRCRVRGWATWIDPLTTALGALLTRPLPVPGSAPLVLARAGRWLAELEFWMAVDTVDVAALDARVCARTLGGAPRPPYAPDRLNGMMKGFIDLVVEHEGRYWVLDYKSNWLGADDAAYTPEAMRAAVLAARYDMQYVLYLLALHRLLRHRLPDYDYDRHMGGALYLFLRGAGAPGAGVHAERVPRDLIETLDALFQGTAPPAARIAS